MQQIKRSELYQLVCTSPLSKVAPQFGTDGIKLAAICRENDVPYPGSSYWTRLALGKEVDLPSLPPSGDGKDPLIAILPYQPKQRQERGASANDEPQEAQHPSPSHEVTAPASTPRPLVKDRLVKPHPIIAGWIADHERRRREARSSNPTSWTYVAAPDPYTDVDRRRFRILDALFRALEASGAEVSETKDRLLRATIDDQHIDFQLREKTKQVKITTGEGRSAYTRTDRVGTGKLILSFKTFLWRYNEEWLETDTKPMETLLPALTERFIEGAALLEEQQKQKELERKRDEEERKRQAELKRQAEEDEKRRLKLAELAADWQTAAQIRAFIGAIKAAPFDPAATIDNRPLADWMTWAEAAADRLDITDEGAEGLFKRIAAVKAERAWR